jgi:hypothetical protein
MFLIKNDYIGGSQSRHGGANEKCTHLGKPSMKWSEVMARFGERYEPAFLDWSFSQSA